METRHAVLRKFSVGLLSSCCAVGLIACATPTAKVSTDPGNGPITPAAATYIYVVDSGTSDILEFSASANGSTSPVATIVPPAGFAAISVATDTSGNIYLAGADVNSNATVLKYAKGASGSATPSSTLLVGNYIPAIEYMTVDSSGRIYVGAENAGILLAVYAAGATGAAVPVRTITDTTNTQLDGLFAAADAAGNLYLSAFDTNSYTGAIVEYSSTANGTVVPLRIITNSSYIFLGIAVDSSDNIYAAADNLLTQAGGAVYKYSTTQTGAAIPALSITGNLTGINFGGGLSVDSHGTIFLLNETPTGNSTYTYNVLTFGSTATGNTAPATTLASSALTAPGTTLAVY